MLLEALKSLVLEQLLRDGGDLFAGLDEDMVVDTLDLIARFKPITIVDNGNPKRAEGGEELLNAIKADQITVQELGKLISSLLRNDSIPDELVRAAAAKLITTTTFRRDFKDHGTMGQDLMKRGYSEKAIKWILELLGVEEPVPPPPPPGDNLIENIIFSIRNKRIVALFYDGDEPGGKGRREIEPVALGTSLGNNQVVRAWDYMGASHSATIGTQPLPGWRLFRLDKVIDYTVTEETFNEMRPSYNVNGDKSMTSLIINAKF